MSAYEAPYTEWSAGETQPVTDSDPKVVVNTTASGSSCRVWLGDRLVFDGVSRPAADPSARSRRKAARATRQADKARIAELEAKLDVDCCNL